MKKNLLIVIVLTAFSIQLYSQKKIPTIKIETFFPLDSLKSVEIYNAWENKKYSLSTKGILRLKEILTVAEADQMLLLKPGHLRMTVHFKNPNTLKTYYIYMYATDIFLDPPYNSNKPIYHIKLKKPIDWNKLNE